MDNQVQAVCGRADIEDVFPLFKRGRVLVFAEQFEGIIPRNGVLVSNGDVTPYSGPEFADGPDLRARVAVVVPETNVTDHLRPGCQVVFYEKA